MNRKIILANAFSIQMLTENKQVSFKEVKPVEMKADLSNFTSTIGHEDTARVLSSILGVNVIPNRCNVTLDGSTTLYVAQLCGGRLPEGSTTLPVGFKFKFYRVETVEDWDLIAVEEDGGNLTQETFTGTYSEAEARVHSLIDYQGMDISTSVRPCVTYPCVLMRSSIDTELNTFILTALALSNCGRDESLLKQELEAHPFNSLDENRNIIEMYGWSIIKDGRINPKVDWVAKRR